MQDASPPPFFLKPLPPDLPAVLLDPCLAPEKFVAVCRDPAILVELVDLIQSTRDLLSFIYVSKEMRAAVDAAFETEPMVRHRFFARFLPGHSLVTRPYWNPRLRIDLTDLELFRVYSFHSPSTASRLISYSRIRGRPTFELPNACPHVNGKQVPTITRTSRNHDALPNPHIDPLPVHPLPPFSDQRSGCNR